MDDCRQRTVVKLNTPNSNLWFIHIATANEHADFTNWLKGKLVRCNDSMEFQEWLAAYSAFPLEIYLDGVTYHFRTREEASFFLLGFEVAARLLNE